MKTPPFDAETFSYSHLRGHGASRHDIRLSLAAGALLHIRRDHYARPTIHPWVRTAIAERGRLACVSLLQLLGVFVHTIDGTHVHVEPGTSHFRQRPAPSVIRHWSPLIQRDQATRTLVDIADAVAQAAACLPLFDVIATLDSVVQKKLMTLRQLHSLSEHLPPRARRLLKHVNGIAESGPETYLRLILQQLGLQFEQQVVILGVGRVDFLVEGWLIIELDSFAHHATWEERKRDMRRDLAAAALGYASLRPLAEDALYRRSSLRDELRAAIDGLRASRAR